MDPMDLMGAIVLVVLMAFAVLAAAAAAFAVLAVRRAMEVSRTHRVGAPLHWVAAPSRAAVLHRRLRNAVVILRRAVPPGPTRREATRIEDLAAEVEALAAALDRELLDVARLPFTARHAALNRTTADVARVEDLVQRVKRVAVDGDPSRLRGEGWERRADEVDHRVDTLREAQDEVDALERRLGLG